jgi:hypothetical protein
MYSSRFEGTQLSGVAPAGKQEMKLVFHKHFSRRNVREDGFGASELGFPRRFRAAVPLVVSVLPESCCGDDEKLGDDDLDSVDEFMTCLDPMESNMFEDNRYGIERLIKLVNSELVNSKKTGSIAQALICGGAGDRHKERLRATFLTYICTTNEKSGDFFDGLLDSDSDSSRTSSELGSCHSDIGGSFGFTVTLKVPAMRILASSLELIASQYKLEGPRLDLSSKFWTMVLASLAQMMEIVNLRRIEATLSIKCIRLLRSMEPSTFDPFIRYSLMPFVVHAHEFGTSVGDQGLIRESKMLLDGLN